jgi:hypothetical protein
MSDIDKQFRILEAKIDALPEVLIRRLDDRYLTKNQCRRLLAAIGLVVMGGLADRLWSILVAFASQ